MRSLIRRLNVYGDAWLRYLFYGVRICPWFLEPLIVWMFTVMFYVFCGPQRRAVAANLRVILPDKSNLEYVAGTFRVMLNFAWTLTDVAHAHNGNDVINWEISGEEHMPALVDSPGGAIILTAHMGNYDLAAPLLSQFLKRRIQIVRAQERHGESQDYMEDKRGGGASDCFVVHYNKPGGMLGVELARLLGAGEIVAIQGDRILFDVSSIQVPFRDGVPWRLPRGPFALAGAAQARIHPIFIVRLGWRRYRIEIKTPIAPPARSQARESRQSDTVMGWSACLRDVIERHWHQWFVFEPVFQIDKPNGTARDPIAAG